LKYAFSRQELLGTYFIDIAAMFFAFPQALYPALAAQYGPSYVGLFPGAIAAGALIASLTSGWTKNVHRHGLMVTVAAVLWGIAIFFFGLANSIVPALFFLGMAGFFDMISGIFRGSIWNQTIPNYLRGRMASIEMISYLTGPYLGSAKMGINAASSDSGTPLTEAADNLVISNGEIVHSTAGGPLNTTNGSGTTPLTAAFSTAPSTGVVTATATALATGDTSEFSICRTITAG